MKNTGHGMSGGEWLSGAPLYTMPGLVALSMAVIRVMPGLTRAVPAPLAGIAVALFLLVFIPYAAPLIEQIPLAALVGVMFMVVIGTFAWNSLTILRKGPLTDALVTIVTVRYDLAIAVVVGVIVSALAYAWNTATRIHAHTRQSVTETGAKAHEIQGPRFFGSAAGFMELFDLEGDPDAVIADFAAGRVVDKFALQAIEAIAAKYEAAGKRIKLRHLGRDCHVC